METRANYLLIGAFTLAGFAALLGFLLWFARVEIDRQFAYYDVFFDSVSGLSNASEVRFSGLLVGQVVDVALDPERTGRVRVRIEVAADTPVRSSSVATIESLGVTGVSYVSISGGDPADPLLAETSAEPVPVIPSRRSALQSLTEDAPQILEEVLEVSRRVSEFLGPANQERVGTILANIEASSGNLERALDDFSEVTRTIAVATEDIAAVTGDLETVSDAATTTLRSADEALGEVTALAERAGGTLDAGDAALASARDTLDTAGAFVDQDLRRLAGEVDRSLAAVRAEVERVGGEASETLAALRETGDTATARLAEAEATVAAADTVLADLSEAAGTVEAAAARVDALVAGDGAAAVAETRRFLGEATELVDTARRVAEEELPGILADIREATETARAAVGQVSADLSAAAGRADSLTADASETLATVADTFERANGTLARLDTALETGESALATAEGAFASADRVLNEELGTLTEDLGETLDGLDAAIAAVAEDVPVIAADLRETAGRANAAFAEIESTAGALGPPLRSFAGEGLPQYSRLAREARELVANLTQLVRQIERDPARYFLGGEQPAFRR